jgi:hypothetical protein
VIVRAKTIPKVYSFTCDGCSSEFLETDCYFYDAALARFRDAGWVTLKPPGKGYQQFCPGCAKRLGVD